MRPFGTRSRHQPKREVVSYGASLRQADASVIPLIIGGSTNAPTIMIAENSVDMIKADARGGA